MAVFRVLATLNLNRGFSFHDRRYSEYGFSGDLFPILYGGGSPTSVRVPSAVTKAAVECTKPVIAGTFRDVAIRSSE